MYRVCQACFLASRINNPPALEKFKNHNGTCKACNERWIEVYIAFYQPHRKWYKIRTVRYDSRAVLCQNKMSGRCYKGDNCRRAHNLLELEIWRGEGEYSNNTKRPGNAKIRCIICNEDFKNVDRLNSHLTGTDHIKQARTMRILTGVGSSDKYTGPIRQRPNVPYGRETYELCRFFAKTKRCRYCNGCKHAHSGEELNVWIEALAAERHRGREKYYPKESDPSIPDPHSRREEYRGACKYPSVSARSESMEGLPEHVKEVYRAIDNNGIYVCLFDLPDHIEIACKKCLNFTVGQETENEQKLLISVKSTKPEFLTTILLYEHRNIFHMGEILKYDKNGEKNELKYQHVPNRTNYQIYQAFDSENYFGVAVLCKPEIGRHRVYIVFHLQDGVVKAKEICVRVRGDGFQSVTDNFNLFAQSQPINRELTDTQLKVNWEQNYELLNTSKFSLKYPMPSYVEDKVTSEYYDHINDQITKQYYAKRFHTLLYLEEFEHKKSLMKYDLQNQRITFHDVVKQVTIENDFGKNYVKRAFSDSWFITLKLNRRLFEGYRSYRPPKVAYIIPNNGREAHKCNISHRAVDYVVVSVTAELISACQDSGGFALVRFTPEREEYVRLHEAVDTVDLPVLFPLTMYVYDSHYWDEDEDYLMNLLRFENLTQAQKLAISTIIDLNYQSYPTLICGPFGCGKSKTIAVAAQLISMSKYKTRVLIVTKTNSCANMYIEILEQHFDTVTMLRQRRRVRNIMYRHFGMRQSVFWNKRVNRYANIVNEEYNCISFEELQLCRVVVTTTVACGKLLPWNERRRSKSLFTHIFIDEAAQVIEPEACIALSLAGPSTKIALAGDIHQSKPLVLSKYGKKYSLDQSLLQRLEMLPEYGTAPLNKCRVNLLENFRSQHTIVEFLSELFYEDSLIANPPSLIGPVNFPALSFLHVSGEEQSLHGFPSYYNEEEAQLTIKALRKLVASGVNVDKIAVLTTYKAQEYLLKEALKQEGSSCRRMRHSRYDCIEAKCINNLTIEYRKLESIQGREYDLIIVNTVRTVSDVPEELSLEERLDLGLLDDVSQFNTILTRARGWVLVIGDSDCLTQVGGCSNVWSKYIQACQQVNGYFATYREFEAFRMETGNTKETKVPNLKTIKNEEIPKSKVPIHSTEELNPVHTADIYISKLNLLESYIATCYQELEVSTDPNITQSIHEQIQSTRMTLEILERQHYLEKDTHQYNIHVTNPYAPMQCEVVAYSPGSQVATQQLLPDMTLPQATPRDQVFYTEGPHF